MGIWKRIKNAAKELTRPTASLEDRELLEWLGLRQVIKKRSRK